MHFVGGVLLIAPSGLVLNFCGGAWRSKHALAQRKLSETQASSVAGSEVGFIGVFFEMSTPSLWHGNLPKTTARQSFPLVCP